MRVPFFLTFRVLWAFSFLVFSVYSLVQVVDQKPVEVEVVLEEYEGPWKRTRGGRDEHFLKLYYLYFIEGSKQTLKKEVSLKPTDDLNEILATYRVANYIVDANSPGETLDSTEQPFVDFIILLFASVVLIVIEYRNRDTGRDKSPY